MPSVSVVMPVHNGARWLDAAIHSILQQSYQDFELVVLDDGSTDGTRAAAETWQQRDRRVRVVSKEGPSGLSNSSNAAVASSTSQLVARMDADDISHPERLERQIAVFQADGEAILVGTLCDGIDEAGEKIRPRDRGRLLQSGYFVPFPHGSVMFRRSDFDDVGGYRESTSGWEDVDLFHRLAGRGKVYVVPDALYSYRYHRANTALTFSEQERLAALAMRNRDLGGPDRDDPSDARAEMLHTQAAMCVWAGVAPSTRIRFEAHALRGPLTRVMRSILYTSWGNVHPKSLRAILALYVAVRDRYATLRLDLTKPFEWHSA